MLKAPASPALGKVSHLLVRRPFKHATVHKGSWDLPGERGPAPGSGSVKPPFKLELQGPA